MKKKAASNSVLIDPRQEQETQRAINSVLAGHAQEQFGLSPYDPATNFPQDLGLGGVSTEYTATDVTPDGEIINYPTIWYDQQGMANLLPQDEAFRRALAYEQSSGKRFPRFNSLGNAETFAQNRSAMGGAEDSPLASLFGFKNYKGK